MTKIPNGFVPYEKQSRIVRILSYQDRNPQGWVMEQDAEQGKAFCSLTQLLLILQSEMDSCNFPQRAMSGRAYVSDLGEEIVAHPVNDRGDRPVATFQLRVMFRQNASWQGDLLWIERSAEARFRSVLELIELMDSALTTAQSDG